MDKIENYIPDSKLLTLAAEILERQGMVTGDQGAKIGAGEAVWPIASDGSTRRFWRINLGDDRSSIAAAPGDLSSAALAESRAAWNICSHLFARGVAVPQCYGWDEESGLLLFEDLSDQRLYGCAQNSGPEELLVLYKEVLAELAKMQVLGAEGFNGDWCWDSPLYDRKIMLERESGYFLSAFWQDYLVEETPALVKEEFADLAMRCSRIDARFFLHRDCQSRNIMISNGAIRFIDFQGGRFGPLGYDVASMLIDPYVGLPLGAQEMLLDYYIQEIQKYMALDGKGFRYEYSQLAMQRNLQIVGAFSFLYAKRGKPFFKPFILPALHTLQERLREQQFIEYANLRYMLDLAIHKLAA